MGRRGVFVLVAAVGGCAATDPQEMERNDGSGTKGDSPSASSGTGSRTDDSATDESPATVSTSATDTLPLEETSQDGESSPGGPGATAGPESGGTGSTDVGGSEGHDTNSPADNVGDRIVQNTIEREMGRPIAPNRRWTYRVSGRCGETCENGPRHMYSASFEDTFLVSWMAVDPDLPRLQYDVWQDHGNVSTFTVSESGEFTHVSDTDFRGQCEAVYGMTSNDDGSVIALLCKGYPAAEILPGAEDLLSASLPSGCNPEADPSCAPIGSYNPDASPLYLFEYWGVGGEAASVTKSPDRIVLINHALAGAHYGHHEILLNQAEDTYFVALKVTNNTGAHQGLRHFGLRRSPVFEYVRLSDHWACGGGHTMVNRMAYNSAQDYWTLLCTNDLCDNREQFSTGRCHDISWSTVPGMSHLGIPGAPEYHEGEQLLSFEPVSIVPFRSPGGATNILSLGDDGWLALAPQPSPNSPAADRLDNPHALGLIHLPVEGSDLDEREWDRIFDYDPSAVDHARYGSANLAYFRKDGEASDRLLLGWSPSIGRQGITSEYLVSVIDREGRLVGEPLVLDEAGWGEDNRWVTMPNSGCVVFAFAWSGESGPGAEYPVDDLDDVSSYPTTMHFTSLCPRP